MKSGALPMRKCLGCNEMKVKSTLYRIVRIEGKAFVDYTHKGQGRGAYVCKSKDCINKIMKKNSLAKALKIRIDEDLYNEIIGALDNEQG